MTVIRLALSIAAATATAIAGCWLTVAWTLGRIHDAVTLPPRSHS